MNTQWIIIASLSLVSLILIFGLLLTGKKLKVIQKKLQSESEKLQQSRATETKLHHELSGLQNKLQLVTDDNITNLLVWPLFEDRLNQAIKESTRYQFTLGLLFIAVDDFKMINDALNAEIGNAFLREVAKRIETCIRQVDSATRFGKETFVVLLSQLGKAEAAAIVAQRILQTLAQPMQIKGHEFFITAAIGIAIFPADGADAATLLRNADDALHAAKQKGKHLYHFYQERINLDSQRELTMSTSMRRESLYQELSLYFQPIMNVKNKSLFALEALLHWQHPELGRIYAHELFAYAEKQHKLNAISEWLIKKACQQFVKFKEQGIALNYMALPMHVKQLENSQFIYQLSQILQEQKFNPEWLLIVIKDVNQTKVNFDVIEKALNMLRYLKVNFVLDNMDGGSLSQIKHFLPSYLRVDPALVNALESTPQAQAILKSMLYLSEQLGIKLIAHGVETLQEMSVLQAMGYDMMQGDYFAPELTVLELPEKLTRIHT